MGLLWFDSDPGRSVTAKAEDAARRYREKFGKQPNTCYVNQASVEGRELSISLEGKGRALRVIPAPNILPNHFWVGVE